MKSLDVCKIENTDLVLKKRNIIDHYRLLKESKNLTRLYYCGGVYSKYYKYMISNKNAILGYDYLVAYKADSIIGLCAFEIIHMETEISLSLEYIYTRNNEHIKQNGESII